MVATPIGWVGLIIGGVAVVGVAAAASIGMNNAITENSGGWYDSIMNSLGVKMNLFSQLLAFVFIFNVFGLHTLCNFWPSYSTQTQEKPKKRKINLDWNMPVVGTLLNVAQALSLPRFVTDKLKQNQLSGLFSDANITH